MTKNRPHTSSLGRKAQGARSRGESRRCSNRHSRGTHNNHTGHRNPPQQHATLGAEDSRVQTAHFRKPKKNWSLTSPMGRKAQGARSRGEPRRCSKRLSRGAHKNCTAHGKSPKQHTQHGEYKTVASKQNTLERHKTDHTLIPWGGRLRAHALGEKPEGAPRDTPAGLTTTL